MRKKISIITLLIFIFILSSCGDKKLKEGTYEGKYESENGGATLVEIKIDSNGKITDVDMTLIDKAGNVKDENYALDSGEKNYEIAQRSIESALQYPIQLVETQDIKKVDSIGGATVTYKEFQEAVKDALSKAK